MVSLLGSLEHGTGVLKKTRRAKVFPAGCVIELCGAAVLRVAEEKHVSVLANLLAPSVLMSCLIAYRMWQGFTHHACTRTRPQPRSS